MDRIQLALVAIALLLSIIEGGADQFNLRRSPGPQTNQHAADDQRRVLSDGYGDGYSLPHPSSSSGGGSSGSSSGGGSSSSSSSSGSGSESSSGGGSESSSGSDGSDGSTSESTEEESESTEDEAIPGWLSEYFSWMGGGDGGDPDPDAGTRSFWSPTGSFARGENGAVNGWPLAMMALTAFVAGIAFMVARKSCREREDDGAPKRKRRWRRGILARKVPVGDAGEEFVEMSFIPTKFTKNGWKKSGAGAKQGSASNEVAGYKAPPAADGLVRESSGSSASSGLPAAYSLANSSSSSSASSSVVIV